MQPIIDFMSNSQKPFGIPVFFRNQVYYNNQASPQDDQRSNEFSQKELEECIVKINNNLITQTLDLRSKELNDRQVIALINALIKKGVVQTLDLSRCRIDDKGARAIADLITQSKSINSINLSYNSISIVGMGLLFQALENNFNIIYFNIEKNLYEEKDYLSRFSSLVTRNLSFQKVTQEYEQYKMLAITLVKLNFPVVLTKVIIRYATVEVVPDAEPQVEKVYSDILTFAYKTPPEQTQKKLENATNINRIHEPKR